VARPLYRAVRGLSRACLRDCRRCTAGASATSTADSAGPSATAGSPRRLSAARTARGCRETRRAPAAALCQRAERRASRSNRFVCSARGS
jgi:hypothetical protein